MQLKLGSRSNWAAAFTAPRTASLQASQPGNRQADHGRQHGPAEEASARRPGIGDCRKAEDDNGCADDPISRGRRTHGGRSNQKNGDGRPRHHTAMLHEPDECPQPFRLDSRAHKYAGLAQVAMQEGRCQAQYSRSVKQQVARGALH